jgi:hypothetical protein
MRAPSTYEVFATARGESIRCLLCRRISGHPQDVAFRYCGACHVFHDDLAMKLELARIAAIVEARL